LKKYCHQQFKTESSGRVTRPTFSTSAFTVLIHATPTSIDPSQSILFGAFNTESMSEEPHNSAKLLGECKYDLDEIASTLLIGSSDNKKPTEIKKLLKFTRIVNSKLVVVGRFNASFLLQEMIDVIPHKKEVTIQKLPHPGFGTFTKWRIKVDTRCANDSPMGGFDEIPSLYIEYGWTRFNKEDINIENIKPSTVEENTRHPLWNEQMHFDNPPEIDKIDGYFWTSIKNKKQASSLERFCFPLSAMKPHHPYNFVKNIT